MPAHEADAERLRTIHWGLAAAGAEQFLTASSLEPEAVVDSEADGVPAFEDFPDAFAGTDAEAAVIAVPLPDRAEAVMQALASDLHVLVADPPAATADDAQRCVVIALNRGVRLMVAVAGAPGGEHGLAQRFRDYALDDIEPPESGRSWLATFRGA